MEMKKQNTQLSPFVVFCFVFFLLLGDGIVLDVTVDIYVSPMKWGEILF